MDKRYLLIIFILVIGGINLALIADHSDVVGTASVNFGNHTFSLPDGFNLGESSEDSVMLIGTNSNLRIEFTALDRNDLNYNETLDDLRNGSDYRVLSNGTIRTGEMTINAIFFTDLVGNNSDEVANNYTSFFFTKDNDTYRINVWNFDYENDRDSVISDLSYILNSLRINYKQMN